MKNSNHIGANDVLFFIGAGCSKDAGIKISTEMVDEIESFINDEKNREWKEWKEFKALYNFIKSCIQYSEGIKGNFTESVNIEKLLVTLNELIKKDDHVIFPFIGAWNNKLIELAGRDFSQLRILHTKINDQLINWVHKDNYDNAKYYGGFGRFKEEFGFPLRVFSLNYDLIFEQVLHNYKIEQGFEPDTHIWDYSYMDAAEKNGAQFILYKLHGSIDWKRIEEGDILQRSVHPLTRPEELIFGIDTKFKSIDPYLYFVFEFRKYLLSCKLLVIIGYSFSDEYLNDLIRQTLQKDRSRKLLSIQPWDPKKYKDEIIINNIKKQLKLTSGQQIKVLNERASTYLNKTLTVKSLAKFVEKEEDIPF